MDIGETLNLKGVPCPQNSAMALLRLEGMQKGIILEIILDDGDPIKNVRLALEEEGYEILNREKTGTVWKLYVRKC